MNYDRSGHIVLEGNEKRAFLVFGSTQVRSSLTDFKSDWHVGAFLDTGEVGSVGGYVTSIGTQDLSMEELNRLPILIDAYARLRYGSIVAFAGKARSGKDFTKNLFKRDFGYLQHSSINFADAVKSAVDVIHGPSSGKKRRKLYVEVGQGARRNNPNVWIEAWLRSAIEHVRTHFDEARILCSDLRQENELMFLHSLGATTVKVVSDEDMRRTVIEEMDGKEGLDFHLTDPDSIASEKFIDEMDVKYVVVNDYTSSTLREQIKSIVKELRKG